MGLDLLHVPVSFSKQRVHKDSTSFGLINESPVGLCTLKIHSETFRHTNRTNTVRENLPQRVRRLIWEFLMECAAPDASHPLRQHH